MSTPRFRRRDNDWIDMSNLYPFNNYKSSSLASVGSSSKIIEPVSEQVTSIDDDGPLLASRTSRQRSATNRLGKPTKKSVIYIWDVAIVFLSFACLGLGLITVVSGRVAWHLGTGNLQLIVLGFLLSIMNLCLGSIAQVFFVLREARFGYSTLQNYEGLLRNSPLGSQLSLIWRIILIFMMVLPLALSAAYKSFGGGQSAISFNSSTLITNASYYGMFAPPGLQGFGANTGISLFSNATTPFVVATSAVNGTEPSLPSQAQPYGFNVLLLNANTTAVLDIPQPHYVSSIQALLAAGESWNITADVMATVATKNTSDITDLSDYASFFDNFCSAGVNSSGAYAQMSRMNGHSVALLSAPSYSNQSLQYIGLTPDPGINYLLQCDEFYNYARLYNINRQFCQATWSVTRGALKLIDGICNGTVASIDKQLPITRNTLFMPVWYMSSLVEFLGPFTTTRNTSVWLEPSLATSMAAML